MKLNSFTARRGLSPVSLAVGSKVQALVETKPRTQQELPAKRTRPTSCKEAWPEKAGWYKAFWATEPANIGNRTEHFRFIEPGVGCSWAARSLSEIISNPIYRNITKCTIECFEGESQGGLELFWYPELIEA